MSFSDFSKIETVSKLNAYLKDKSYIEGYVLHTDIWTKFAKRFVDLFVLLIAWTTTRKKT